MSTHLHRSTLVRSRTIRCLPVLLLVTLILPRASARAHEQKQARATGALPDAWLTVARFAHATGLYATGASIARSSDDRLQQSHNDCALAIVEQLHQRAHRPLPDRAQLARTLHLTDRGVALQPLAATLTQLGWPAVVVRERTARATALHPPAIALLTPGHFVLVTRRTATHVEFFDPLVGQVTQPLPPFEARWTGKSVQLSRTDN